MIFMKIGVGWAALFYEHKWKHMYPCIAKVYGILKVKINACVKSVF
jgi:hypothetical protein